MNKVTTNEKEVKLLRNVDTRKAIGPDGVNPRLLQRCTKELSSLLTLIFNTCLSSCKWPTPFETNKILEKITSSQLTNHINKNHLLSTRQNAFRKKRSAAELLLQMTADWSAALDCGQRTYVLAMDIEGTFDRVWHLGLLSKLKAFGVDVLVNVKHYDIKAGVPQGSI
ncbi:uncharacterized protein LOC125043720 [Penaeus chinensis]|uniref:uncharacterized protein LOC125043720 n=1 Tax=Penaeus chinensis TaxID=139456 RepID=UPI001FB76124|nr:uncharacterized protein LOC125043720 [Penaeus chinensis]